MPMTLFMKFVIQWSPICGIYLQPFGRDWNIGRQTDRFTGKKNFEGLSADTLASPSGKSKSSRVMSGWLCNFCNLQTKHIDAESVFSNLTRKKDREIRGNWRNLTQITLSSWIRSRMLIFVESRFRRSFILRFSYLKQQFSEKKITEKISRYFLSLFSREANPLS